VEDRVMRWLIISAVCVGGLGALHLATAGDTTTTAGITALPEDEAASVVGGQSPMCPGYECFEDGTYGCYRPCARFANMYEDTDYIYPDGDLVIPCTCLYFNGSQYVPCGTFNGDVWACSVGIGTGTQGAPPPSP